MIKLHPRNFITNWQFERKIQKQEQEMNYNKVWEKMNHLEESFSSISTIKELVDDVDRMIDCEDFEKT